MPIDLIDSNPNNATRWHFAFEGAAMNSKLCFPLINIVLLVLLAGDIIPFGIQASASPHAAGGRVGTGPETALVFSCKNARTKTHAAGKFGYLKTIGNCRSSSVSSHMPRLIMVREAASVLPAFDTGAMETESI